MTLRETIQAKIDSYKAEVASLEAHLAAGGAILDQEEHTVDGWFTEFIAKLRAKL